MGAILSHDFVGQEFGQDSLGDSSTEFGTDWSHPRVFSWWLSKAGWCGVTLLLWGARCLRWWEGWALLGASPPPCSPRVFVHASSSWAGSGL